MKKLSEWAKIKGLSKAAFNERFPWEENWDNFGISIVFPNIKNLKTMSVLTWVESF
jgi:hypothetical protein